MDGLCEVSTSIWVLLLSEQRFRSGENSVGQWVQHLVQHCSILSRTLTSCSTSSRLTPWFKLTFQQLLRPDGGHVWCCVHVALRMIYRISLVTWYQICIPFLSSCKQSWFFFLCSSTQLWKRLYFFHADIPDILVLHECPPQVNISLLKYVAFVVRSCTAAHFPRSLNQSRLCICVFINSCESLPVS